MLNNQEYTVKIEKMINEGKGIARVDNFPLFVDNCVPEDILKVKIKKLNKNYAVAEIVEIEKPSEYRVKPLCPMHNICGGCGWQQIEYSRQLIEKQNIVFETLKNVVGTEFRINTIIASPKTSEYRCKVQYPVSQKKSGRLISGYYKKGTHELINIKYCPMHSEIISEIVEYIKEISPEFNISGYNEKTSKGLLRHIICRQSESAGEILVIFVINSEKIPENIKSLAKNIKDKFSVITGICANFNTDQTNVILGKRTQSIIGNDYYFEKIDNITYKISANSFFQVNPNTAKIIFNYAKEIISKNVSKPKILDAYSGVSSFGIWLASIASKVVSIEEVESASKDAEYNAKINNINNIEIINGDAGKEFNKLIKLNTKFDVVLIDPPRKGSSKEALDCLSKLTDKYILYVSCNPATLARDIKILKENNFIVELIQPVDMFPNTAHIETIVLLKKQQ